MCGRDYPAQRDLRVELRQFPRCVSSCSVASSTEARRRALARNRKQWCRCSDDPTTETVLTRQVGTAWKLWGLKSCETAANGGRARSGTAFFR